MLIIIIISIKRMKIWIIYSNKNYIYIYIYIGRKYNQSHAIHLKEMTLKQMRNFPKI